MIQSQRGASRSHTVDVADEILAMDVIFNFTRYEELRQSVLQLVRENLDPDLLQDEAHDLFETWWAADPSCGLWNEDVKQRIWTSLWQEFGTERVQP